MLLLNRQALLITGLVLLLIPMEISQLLMLLVP